MTDDRPLVSVVVPTYYRNERLRGALGSVADQTHDRVEAVVVDGSGEAHARPVVEELEAERDLDIEYVAQERDEGPHAARSEGAERARGDHVNFLDDDDRLRPAKLERQLALLQGSDGVGVVYCAVEWEDGHVVRPDPDVRGDVLEHALRFRMTPSSPSAMLVDGDVLRAILPLENRHGADDMGMKIELAARTGFDFVDEPLVVKGDEEDSLGGSRENVAGRFELLERYADRYERHPAARRDALGHTYLLSADLRLDAPRRSPLAIADAARACYHVPGLPVSFVGYLGASLFGRPGRDLARAAYDRFVLGEEHTGKVT
jgi:glycosyltransferase involved in cell wall biosynthesis